jgi:hypothetical protein
VTTFNGYLTVKMGAGDDTMTGGVSGEPGNSVVGTTVVTLDGGIGNDTLSLANGAGPEPHIINFETVT